MYGMYPFSGKYDYSVVISIVQSKLKKPPNEREKYYSKDLKDILSLLLSHVYFYILFIKKINIFNRMHQNAPQQLKFSTYLKN
jgi:hypothetical protein